MAMALNVGILLLLGSLAFAHPASDEALQPCGGAFYYPSKVYNRFLIRYQIPVILADHP
jgi:hypothetical protein